MDLHMIGGQGETSYANNSLIQRSNIIKTRKILEEAVEMLCSNILPKTMNIADLGCSSGPNALLSVNMIVEAVQDSCGRLGQPTPEFHIFLNDLPGNDFNTLFKTIPTFLGKLQGGKGGESGSYYVCGSPGSFYGRLFPTDGLHFVYSANSLHWLSQVPLGLSGKVGVTNKGNITLGKTSPPGVFEVYFEQFRQDFLTFLRLRSKEIVSKGFMVISLFGRTTMDPFVEECSHGWQDLAYALQEMVEEGIVEEEKLDSFNMPYYEPHIEEVQKVIEEEGSFNIIRLEESLCEVGRTTKNIHPNNYNLIAKSSRAVTEPMLARHFEPVIMDQLFKRCEEILPFVSHKQHFLIFSLSKKG